MITYSNANNDAVWELIGLSTDEKPIDGIPNGSTFQEMNTGKMFMFDAESKTWHEQPTTSTSSGGNSGTTTPDDDEPTDGDVATDEEVKDAIDDIFG